jgi:hypothetical protein
MCLLEWMLALWIWTGQYQVKPEQVQDIFPVVRTPLICLALKLEIIDKRELRYVLVKVEDFESDLRMLQVRQEALHDAPLLADAQRLPSRAAINEWLAFNRIYRKYMEEMSQIGLVSRQELVTAQRGSDKLYQVWDAARDAQCSYYYTTVRRQAMQTLCKLLGPERFYRGELPTTFPLWQLDLLDRPISMRRW